MILASYRNEDLNLDIKYFSKFYTLVKLLISSLIKKKQKKISKLNFE